MVTAQIALTLSHIFSIFSLALPYALHTHRPSNLHNSLANNKYLNSALKNRAIAKYHIIPGAACLSSCLMLSIVTSFANYDSNNHAIGNHVGAILKSNCQ